MASKRSRPKRYVIFGYIDDEDGQPLFWSNRDGWVSLESATVFSHQKYNLPSLDGHGRAGVWVGLPR